MPDPPRDSAAVGAPRPWARPPAVGNVSSCVTARTSLQTRASSAPPPLPLPKSPEDDVVDVAEAVVTPARGSVPMPRTTPSPPPGRFQRPLDFRRPHPWTRHEPGPERARALPISPPNLHVYHIPNNLVLGQGLPRGPAPRVGVGSPRLPRASVARSAPVAAGGACARWTSTWTSTWTWTSRWTSTWTAKSCPDQRHSTTLQSPSK